MSIADEIEGIEFAIDLIEGVQKLLLLFLSILVIVFGHVVVVG